ncbi:hypothetical protein RND81_01G172800 [Saponaria officinalis]|uniref:F-box/LRR-repeat protein 15/At3g58940/PEG3-like LRR domain-containing protein n=1 Tax=Saponaria officinalis TaxID=3572 RepID=A0AAW1NJB0_SAPOF
MESRPKKMIRLKGTNNFDDRLSGMPDHLIVHILSFMPTLDAVKTMLLRRFGNLWTLVPALWFDFDLYDRICLPDDEEVTYYDVFTSFARFVRNVLLLHRSPTIDSFRLFIKPLEIRFEDRRIIHDIQMWLRFVTDRQVKDVDFCFDGFDKLALPHCIVTSQSLTRLTLFGCTLEHRPHVDFHMESLRELSLSDVKGSNEAFNQVISGCPNLREVKIDGADELSVLNITPPSVHKLCLNLQNLDHSFTLSCPNVKILEVAVSSRHESFMVDAVAVSSLQLVNVADLPYVDFSPFETFLRQIRNVDVFTLSRDAFQKLCWGKVKINFPRNRWKRMVLRPCMYDKKCLQRTLELLKSSVKLEELIIYSEFARCIDEYESPQLSTTICEMPRLKKVTILRSGGFSKFHLQLVELLLGNAVVLEKLVITPHQNPLTVVDEMHLIKQVSKFRRASANASVIFA